MIQTGITRIRLLTEEQRVRLVINADADPKDMVLLQELVGKRMTASAGIHLYCFEVGRAYYEGSWLVVETSGKVLMVNMLDDWLAHLKRWEEDILKERWAQTLPR